jgi:hypothetical protein
LSFSVEKKEAAARQLLRRQARADAALARHAQLGGLAATNYYVGDIKVELRQANIHSEDGLVIYLPSDRILPAGDTLEDTLNYLHEVIVRSHDPDYLQGTLEDYVGESVNKGWMLDDPRRIIRSLSSVSIGPCRSPVR